MKYKYPLNCNNEKLSALQLYNGGMIKINLRSGVTDNLSLPFLKVSLSVNNCLSHFVLPQISLQMEFVIDINFNRHQMFELRRSLPSYEENTPPRPTKVAKL